MWYKSVTSCIPKDKENTYLLTFMANIILRVLKLNVKVNPLSIVNLIRIWMRGLREKAKSWTLNIIFKNFFKMNNLKKGNETFHRTHAFGAYFE